MGRPRLVVASAFLAATSLFVLLVGVSSAAGHPPEKPRPQPQAPADPPPAPSKHPKLSSIVSLVEEAAVSVAEGEPLTTANLYGARPELQAYLTAGLIALDYQGRIQVYLHLSSAGDNVLAELESLGAIVERQDESERLVQARIPVNALSQVADLEYVTAVTPPTYGSVSVGSRLTQGDTLLDFDDLRSTLGIDGSGVTVGVISDGILGLADAVASVDLPATTLNRDGSGKLVSTTGGVIGTSFRADGNLEGKLSGPSTGAEGTAILEIVHDIAPQAQLRFANFATGLEFIAAVDFLAANSDVVVDDIGFFGTPYDQSSNVSTNTSTELNRPGNRIRGHYTSVGNQALRHYQETYVNSGTDGNPFVGATGGLHRLAATSDTADCLSLGARIANSVLLAAGQTATIILTWDDTFGSATTDYDLFVTDNDTGTVVTSGTDDNPGATKVPVETVAFTNGAGSSKFYDIFIQNAGNASAAKTFDMFVLGGSALNCTAKTLFNYNTVGSSVLAQSDAGGGVVSVGAISASDPGSNDIEAFSSRGPTNNGVTKPDVSAIDGVSVTGSGGFPGTFFGTSAAAPHVAGLAALLLQRRPGLKSGEAGDNPSADRVALRAAIVDTAVDLGASGSDNTFGSGRVNGVSAAQALATPTPTPTPVPSQSLWGLVILGAAFALLSVVATRRRGSQHRAGRF